MNKILAITGLLVALLGAGRAYGQAGTITVTGTAQDPSGTTWNNGTYSASYVIPPGAGAITNTATGQTISPTIISGTLNGSGAFSITLVSTANVYPAISGVTFRICPQMTNSPCYTTVPISIGTTSPQSVSAQIDLVLQNPSVTGAPLAQAYNDGEVTAVLGNQYVRLSDSTFRCYTTSWGACGGGGGTGNLSGTLTSGYYPVASGANTLVNGTIDFGVSTPGSLTVQPPSSDGLILNSTGGIEIIDNSSGIEITEQVGGHINLTAPSGAIVLGGATAEIDGTITMPDITGHGTAGVLLSSSVGAVSQSLALPSGLSATNMTLTTPALGTPASGVITNLTGTCTACTANAAVGISTNGTANQVWGMNSGGSAQGWQTSSSSGFPLNFIQSAPFVLTSGGTYTFPAALQSSGATAFIIICIDTTSAFTTPTGWTVDLNQASASSPGSTNERLVLLHKTSASDTTVNFSSIGATAAGRFYEISGSHALDQSSTGFIANSATVTYPAITPTAGAVVFGAAGFAQNGTPPVTGDIQSPAGAPYESITSFSSSANTRTLVGFIGLQAATNVSTKPPQSGFPTATLFSSTGIAYMTFSIL
jgi:hypothetical protein